MGKEMGLAKESRKGDPGGGEKRDTLNDESAVGCWSRHSQGTETYQMGEDGETHQFGAPHRATHHIGETSLGDHIINPQLWITEKSGRASITAPACPLSATPNGL